MNHKESIMSHIQIAIDGPSGAGKSSLSKAAAKALGIIYVDTGALYRTVGYYAREIGLPADKAEIAPIVNHLHEITIEVKYENGVQCVYLNGENLGDRIRSSDMSMYASAVSAVPAVRAFLLDTQKDIAAKNSVIMDGRDIGTVVLPDAEVKIYLTASAEERARRRVLQLAEKGENVAFEQVLQDIEKRDYDDMHRAVAPLRRAEDAVLADTSDLDLAGSIDLIRNIICSRGEVRA